MERRGKGTGGEGRERKGRQGKEKEGRRGEGRGGDGREGKGEGKGRREGREKKEREGNGAIWRIIIYLKMLYRLQNHFQYYKQKPTKSVELVEEYLKSNLIML